MDHFGASIFGGMPGFDPFMSINLRYFSTSEGVGGLALTYKSQLRVRHYQVGSVVSNRRRLLSLSSAETTPVLSVNYGTGTCDVTRKFLAQSAAQATDLGKEDFMGRKELIKGAI